MANSIVPVMFAAFFPAIFGTVAIMFVFTIILAIPTARARKQILQEMNAQFVTETLIEQQMAKKHPRLYNARLYAPAIMLGTMIVLYVVSFVVLMFFVTF